MRLIAAPFYLAGKQIHSKYLWLLLQGAVPGLVIGIVILRLLNRNAGSPLVIILLGVILMASSSVTFIRRIQNQAFARKNSRWLPWLALPIGVESGFSSAGAGALGTVLLLNYSEMTPTQVVGTDLLFGLVLAVIGSAFHWTFGSVSMPVLFQLLAGGIPGVVFGCLLARRIPAARLKTVVAMIAIFAGLQLMWAWLPQACRKIHCHQLYVHRARRYGQGQVEGSKQDASGHTASAAPGPAGEHGYS